VRQLIKKILREQSETKAEKIRAQVKKSGVDTVSNLVGGIDNLINMAYDGDLMKFSEDTTTPIVYLAADQKNLYLHNALVEKLGLKEIKWAGRNEKELGKFGYGPKVGHRYLFTATLYPTTLHDQKYWKVVGSSGDSGFGYSFINQRNILGIRYRTQIFNQIINKYNLRPYMKVKVFY
jgi:hypothetical protein